jgi:protein SCO1/2
MAKLTFLFGLFVLLQSCSNDTPPKLPILGNADILYKTVDGKEITDTIYPKIPAFTFLNQDSLLVTNESYKNRVWVVEFFFATCPTICPIMNVQSNKLNQETKKYQKHIQFLSFSINPTHDLPFVLTKYKRDHGITATNWDFLTGNEAETHRLGIENFLTFAGRDDEAEGGYAHSGSFTLVDKAGHVRGVYAVTNMDLSVNAKEYKRLKTDLINLLNYEYHVK